MKQRKVVGTITRGYFDDDGELFTWEDNIWQFTIWGRVCHVGRELLYRTHLRKRPDLMALLRRHYMPVITESLYEASPLLERLNDRNQRRGSTATTNKQRKGHHK